MKRHNIHVFILMSDGDGDMVWIGRLNDDADGIDDVGRYFIVPRTLVPYYHYYNERRVVRGSLLFG